MTREEVVASYSSLARCSARQIDLDHVLPDLPPFLCRQLIRGDNLLSDYAELHEVYTGDKEAKIEWWGGGQNRGLGLIREAELGYLTHELPLRGYQPSPDRERLNASAARALDIFRKRDDPRLETILSWTSLLVWLARVAKIEESSLTSSSFPAVPHCTFLTPQALRHIPPNNTFAHESEYALRENLFHEALHQKLAATFLHLDVLAGNYSASTAPKIAIPWRKMGWEPDRVVHAVYVYTSIVRMRQEELQHDVPEQTGDAITKALDGSIAALRYLFNQLGECRRIFSAGGEQIFYDIKEDAANVLARLN